MFTVGWCIGGETTAGRSRSTSTRYFLSPETSLELSRRGALRIPFFFLHPPFESPFSNHSASQNRGRRDPKPSPPFRDRTASGKCFYHLFIIVGHVLME